MKMAKLCAEWLSAGKHPRDILDKIDANLLLVEGNHDANNGVKAHAKFMIVEVGQYKALLSHYPTFNHRTHE